MHNPAYNEDLAFVSLQRWGNHASIPLIERECSLFTHSTIEGLIGYHERKSSRIIFGDPLCDRDHKASFAESFQQDCSDKKLNTIYLNTSQTFSQWFKQRYGGTSMSLGNELIINPQRDVRKETGFYARDLRWKHKKSVREGISVHEYTGHDPALEHALQEVAAVWLSHRTGKQACLFPLNLFKNRKGKRWFYAQHKNRITGVLTMNEIPAHRGWVINMLMCTPSAVNSTSAFMLMQLFEILSTEGCEFFSAGFIPDKSLTTVEGFGPLKKWWLRKSYTFCSKMLKLQSKKQFWNQFEPIEQPTYLISRAPWRLTDVAALMQTLHIIG